VVLIYPSRIADVIGFAGFALLILLQWLGRDRAAAA
jgi:hypothetical protein